LSRGSSRSAQQKFPIRRTMPERSTIEG